MSERCLVVMPAYNKASSLRGLVEEVLLVGDLLGEPSVNVLVVDDRSPDGTGNIAEELRSAHRGRVDVLHRLDRLGAGTAYVTGFRYALASDYDYAIQMAADFSHDPSLLPRLLRAARDADVVVGSRHIVTNHHSPVPFWRNLLSRVGSLYARSMLGLGVSDVTGGYKCFRRSALEALDLAALKGDDEAFQIEVAYQCTQLGLRIVEVAALPRERIALPPVTATKLWEALLEVWELRWAGAVLLRNVGLGVRRPAVRQATTMRQRQPPR